MSVFFKFLALIFLFTTTIYSQNFPSEKQADGFIAALQKQKVDTICTLKHDAVGYIGGNYDGDCPKTEKTAYIFWKKDGKTYLTQKNNCKEYPVIEIKDDQFWNIYFESKELVATQKIKVPEVIVKDSTGTHIHKTLSFHYSFKEIALYTNGKRVLDDKSPDNFFHKKLIHNRKNINYSYNTSTVIYKLRIALDKIIKNYSKRFVALK
ncbi:hypothetical protein ACLI08_12325 [Flavobacterium sp. RNTU_13]|uniref:hypothetical protein n=1 Tax=Flavobacterium sp. RNTU_13 TaxID=3375145 RepID=UPI003987BE03